MVWTTVTCLRAFLFWFGSYLLKTVSQRGWSEKLHILPGFSKLQQWHWKLQIMQIFLSFFLCLRTCTGSGCFFCWLVASARLEKEETDATSTIAPEACCDPLHSCFHFFLNLSAESLVQVVLQLYTESPAAFGVTVCSVNEYLHIQVSW